MNTAYVLNRVCPALESGEYAQTTKALRRATGYCCLGVMVDLAFRDGLANGEWDKPRQVDDGRFVASFDGGRHTRVDYLPEAVREVLGFGSDEGPGVRAGDGWYPSLAAANDDGRTFAEIAAALRTLAEAERAATAR